MKDFRKQLRENMTDVERKLWYSLKDRRFGGLKFRRQHPIGPYVVDFYCAEKHLVVELDGGQHAMNEKQDQEWSRYLELQGYKIIRFWNNDIQNNIEGVLQRLSEYICDPSPSPLPLKRERDIL
ncbi:MAG: endonuclease domain-containing protein [candidate division FCPU426 bacterium]